MVACGEERHAIFRFDDLRRALQSVAALACRVQLVALLSVERSADRGVDLVARLRALAGVFELRRERAHALQRAPVTIGHDGNRVVELHHFLHAGQRFGRCSVDGHELGAEHRRCGDGRVQHLRQRHIDAVGRRAIDLRRDIDSRRRLADDRVVVTRLERRMHRRCEQRCLCRELAVRERAARSGMRDFRKLRAALGSGNVPLLRCSLDQHDLRCCAGEPHAEMTGAAHGAAAAGHLEVHHLRELERPEVDAALHVLRHDRDDGHERAHQVAVRVVVGAGSFLDAHLAPVGLQFLGAHHRERRVHAGAHFAMRDDHGNGVVGADLDPGGELGRALAIVGHDAQSIRRERDAGDAEGETAADQAAGRDDGAASPLVHGAPPSVGPCATAWIARRTRS